MNKFLTLLAALVLAAACSNDAPSKAAEASTVPPLPEDVRSVASTTSPIAVAPDVQPVATATIADGMLSATGEFVSPSSSSVAPKYPARVARVLVDAGERVSQGQPLLEVETQYTRIEIQRAEAALAQAVAAANEAQRDFERKKELFAKQSIPQALHDRSQAAYEQSRAGVAAAQATVAAGRQRLSDATLRSPLTGVVAERRTDVGEFLADGGVAFVVVQTAPLKLRFKVPEKYLGQVHRGQAVSARVDPYPDRTFDGKVTVVGGTIDSATRTMFAEAEFSNRDGKLRPGLFARVEMELK